MHKHLKTFGERKTCTIHKLHTKEHTPYSVSFFSSVMDSITLLKTASTVLYEEPIVMVIQLVLMDTLAVMNLWGEKFSRQIAAHMVNVNYVNVRCRGVVRSCEVGGCRMFPHIIEGPLL